METDFKIANMDVFTNALRALIRKENDIRDYMELQSKKAGTMLRKPDASDQEISDQIRLLTTELLGNAIELMDSCDSWKYPYREVKSDVVKFAQLYREILRGFDMFTGKSGNVFVLGKFANIGR